MRILVSFWKGLLRLVGTAIIIAIMSYFIINTIKIYRQTVEHQDKLQRNMTHLLLSQTSLSAAPLIEDDNMDALYLLSTQIASEVFVQNITFYNNDGIRLVSNTKKPTTEKDDKTVVQNDSNTNDSNITDEDTTSNDIQASIMDNTWKYTQLVNPIIHNQQSIGFVRITFEPQKIQVWPERQYVTNLSQIYVALGVSFLCGGLFMQILINPLRRRLKRKRLANKNKN